MTKTRKLTFVFTLLIVVLIIGTGTSVSRASLGMDDEVTQIKETIYAYFMLRYDALKANKSYVDYSPVIDDLENCSTEWLQMESDLRALRHFIHSIYEVTIIDYRFRLDFESIHVDGDEAVVKLKEGNEIYYKRRPTEPSKLANIEHEIWLRKTENGWLITNDKYSDDFTKAFGGSSLATLIANVRRNHDHQRGDRVVEDQNPSNPPESTADVDLQYYDAYARDAAVNFADTYWDSSTSLGPIPQKILDSEDWYPGWDETYRDYGDIDCTNFVSQAVFEGIAYTPTDPNYFYPDPANWSEWWYFKFSDPADGSLPWISVGDFWEFLTENHYNYENYGLDYVIRGPTGKSVDLCDIRLGDVI